ncbi:TetR/AcrR family transcriptional regulator [Kineosporia sp. NBRC 101731]|uniref:TetR/AcrR family transcriptional regulator n=1 Tax=Kineosporia sp. NBRC 101731 TaxID=3032199 RepID=UPI0024A51385|nr:TetR/AcrR family transcriptional regulator [Kineosporia sp. NBRC 101731]GLY29573.1 TetR family transcriptional regulator [Kineosporia sp. NBRC 101731]
MAGTSRDAKRALTAQRILEAARQEFAAQGFEGTTIRGIARVAGVDPSLVMQHYGSKAALFHSAVQLPVDDDKVASEHLLEVLTVRLGELPPETRALVRSMLTVPEATESMRAYLDERVDNLTRSLDGDDAQLRALLTVSGILGLTITQHFLQLNAFDGVSQEALLRAARGWIASLAGDEPVA